MNLEILKNVDQTEEIQKYAEGLNQILDKLNNN